MVTAYCYDEFNTRHHLDGHPENRQRFLSTWELLQSDGIVDRLCFVESTPISNERLLYNHPESYVEQVRSASNQELSFLDPDTYVTGDSYHAALLAAGGAVNVLTTVLDGQAMNGYALVRPPGHHATPTRAMGFCLFNSVALAAHVALREYGLDRILIVDFDVHHGNGTQDSFYDLPQVLFCSLHQSPLYPGTGSVSEVGDRDGRGYTLNLPLHAGVGDEGYMRAFTTILLPVARRYDPQLVLVSAGYDGHWDDPLALMRLSIHGYAQLWRFLLELADEVCEGRLLAVQEGGYHLDVLSHSVLTALRLLENPQADVSDPLGPAPHGERPIGDVLARAATLHNINTGRL